MFYANDPAHLRKAMQKQELEELNFKFDLRHKDLVSMSLPIIILAGGLGTRLGNNT